MAGDIPGDDVEKQRRGDVDDSGSAEKTIDCHMKGEPQLERSSSSHEECSIFVLALNLYLLFSCYIFDVNDDVLINLGCQCRGALSKAHLSCIIKWFNTRGSNKCEICQQIAANVTPPGSQTGYWVWRVDPVPVFRAQEHERRCFSPLWVAFSILVGGLLLDLLISITLGVSALPVNISIGVIVLLGLGTAFRLALEFFRERNVRRVVQRVEANASIGYYHAL